MAETADRNCTHLAGEYFVAAEFYCRGYSVAITPGNAKAIDLFREMEHGRSTFKRRPPGGRKVVEGRSARPHLDNVVYVFIRLNEPGTPPQYFIRTPDEARAKVRQYPAAVSST